MNGSGIDALATDFGQIDLQQRRVRPTARWLTFRNKIDTDLGVVINKGITDCGEHLGSFRPGHAAHRAAMREGRNAFARLYFPQLAGRIGRRRQ